MRLEETLKFSDGDNPDLKQSSMLAHLWDTYIDRYSYNTKEAADEWWAMWGGKMQEYA